MGIDWWRRDPMLTGREEGLEDENRQLRERIEALESAQEKKPAARQRAQPERRRDG
jgi:hypothetical protein